MIVSGTLNVLFYWKKKMFYSNSRSKNIYFTIGYNPQFFYKFPNMYSVKPILLRSQHGRQTSAIRTRQAEGKTKKDSVFARCRVESKFNAASPLKASRRVASLNRGGLIFFTGLRLLIQCARVCAMQEFSARISFVITAFHNLI